MADLTRQATLTVDLSAICANYRLLKERHAKGKVAAVIKADAYGLGMAPVAQALFAREGCHEFFVATLEEAITLRGVLPEARITVFQGVLKGEARDYLAHRLRPVLNAVSQIVEWHKHGKGKPAALHVDTGMCRLGLSLEEFARIDPHALLREVTLSLVMSHLACASEQDDPLNALQRQRFAGVTTALPGLPASLANSSGHFLSPEFHFDLGRPGCALYGITPLARGEANPMRQVATWTAPILQVRRIEREETVGYGATSRVSPGMRVATVAAGYADGLHRQASRTLPAWIDGHACPMLGRVSMDTSCYDVSEVSDKQLARGYLTLMDDAQPVDALAEAYDTIGYEVLTAIGGRVKREYVG